MASPQPLTLAIEISNPTAPEAVPPRPGPSRPAAGVALGRVERGIPAQVVGVEWLGLGAGHDNDLMPAIGRLFDRAGASRRDVGRIAVSAGPGGFTSLRIGAAAAKMIAMATGARCVAVPTASALIRRVDPALRRQRKTAVCLAWKRRDAWRAVFPQGEGLDPVAPPCLVSLDRLIEPVPMLLVADAALVHILRDEGLLAGDVAMVEPTFDPVAVLEASASHPDVAPALLAPIYPREPEAVANRRLRRTPAVGGR